MRAGFEIFIVSGFSIPCESSRAGRLGWLTGGALQRTVVSGGLEVGCGVSG